MTGVRFLFREHARKVTSRARFYLAFRSVRFTSDRFRIGPVTEPTKVMNRDIEPPSGAGLICLKAWRNFSLKTADLKMLLTG